MREVPGSFGIDTQIFTPHSTRIGSSTAVHKLSMPWQEILKTEQLSNVGKFSTYIFREIEDSLGLDNQQLMYINVKWC